MAIRRTGSQTLVNRGVTAAAATPVNIITGSGGGGATVNISSIQIANSTFVAKDDLAIDTAGGYLIINGTGFQSGAAVYIQGTAATSTAFVSSSRLNVTVPALSSGLLDVYVVNTDGSGSIYLRSLNANGTPSWTTTSPLTSQDDGTAFAINLVASGAAGDGTITYAVSSGSTLPSGTFLASNGYFYGTVSGIEQETTYSFSVDAIDAQNQETARSFNITVRSGDQYLKDTVLLLNGETSNNTWITDTSANNFVITVNGDTRPVAFSPYETVWSNYFDGTGDFLSVSANSAFSYGTGDFTYDAWIYPTSDGAGGTFRFIMGAGGSGQQDQFLINSAGNRTLMYFDGVTEFTTTNQFTLNSWNHVAVSRSSGTLRVFINGIQGASGSSSTNITIGATNTYYIGNRSGGADSPQQAFIGFISNARVIKGTGLYTSNFTPSTSPLTAITNTSLLTCQSNRLIDNSTNNFTITKNGDVSVSNFGPFVETDITTGSGYFNGTTDFLTVPNNSAFLFGSGDFTVEAWVYPISMGSDRWIAGFWSYTEPNNQSWALVRSQTNNSYVFIIQGTGAEDYLILEHVSNIVLNAWIHIAVTRSGSSWRMFLNGTVVATNTYSGTLANVSTVLRIGYVEGAPSTYHGHISNLRILKGTALYTSNFTPPTSPLTAIANTSLLTLQSRIGENNNRFIDSSGINNIITRSGNTSQGTFSPYQRGGWSNYFDGNADSLSIPTNAALDLGNTSGDFTVEAWVYLNAMPTGTSTSSWTPDYSQWFVIYERSAGGTDGWQFRIGQTLLTLGGNGDSSILWGTHGMVPRTWYHVAVTRSGSTYRLFVNGSQIASGSSATGLGSGGTYYIGSEDTSGAYFNGYISNLRVLKGTALYTGAFTAPTLPLTAIANTSLLTCADSSIVDDSPLNFTITKTGDVSVQPFSPFKVHTITANTHSVYFDGTGDYLSIPDSQTFMNIGTNNLTIEGWVYFNSVGTGTFFGAVDSGGNSSGGVIIYLSASGTLRVYGPSVSGTITTSVVTGTWYHIAVTRQTNTWTLWLNGTSQGTFTDSGSLNPGSTRPLGIGRLGAYDGFYLTGYVSNVRFINGTALYTSNFTPPTSPLTAISNTSLLTCSSNTIVDLSTANTGNTAYAITVNGNARATTVNPLGFTVTNVTGTSAEYSITNEGGSMYFDGTGDYLTLNGSTALTFGTGDFTIEFWVNPSQSANEYMMVDFRAANGAFPMIGHDSSRGVFYYLNSSWRIVSNTVLTPRAWYHISVTRSGNSTKLFINGAQAGSTFTDSTNLSVGSNRPIIGANGESLGALPLTGYISNLRILKGTALYTSGFVPPAAPPLPIAGTTLLVNGTNGSIVDYTRKNNLETVGDVRIRNNIKKYGNTSMFFDGTDDRLKVPYSPNLLLGSGDFTVEMWLYKLANNAYMVAAGNLSSPSTAAWIIFADATGNKITWYTNGNFQMTSTTSLATGTWYHLAITRSGTTGRMFINGTQEASWTDSVNYNVTNDLFIGNDAQLISGRHWNGYIDDLRITKGVARYTSNFTAPTRQLQTN